MGAVAIDEAAELSVDDYIMLLGRCRNTADPCRQLFAATNPDAEGHHLYKRFFDSAGLPVVNARRRCIHSTSLENFLLPQDYRDALSTFTGQNYRRYVEGRWGAFEGLIHEVFDPQVHVRERDPSEFTDYVFCMDEGFRTAVVLVLGLDSDRRIHISPEWYRHGILPAAHVEASRELNQRFPCSAYVGDPSAAALIQMMQNAGLPAFAGNNDVAGGIRMVQDRWGMGADGRPRMTISPECVNTIMELRSYRYRPGTDKPEKEFDHAMDALRYGIMYIDGRTRVRLIPIADRGRGPGSQAANAEWLRADNDALWTKA